MEYEDLKRNLLDYLKLTIKSNLSTEERQVKNNLYFSIRGYHWNISGEELLDLGEEIKKSMEDWVKNEVYEELKKGIETTLTRNVRNAESDIKNRLELLVKELEEIVNT